MHKNAFILPVSFALVCSMSSRPNVALGGKCSNFLHGLQYAKYSNAGFQLITPVAVERFAQWPPSLSLVPAAWPFSNIIWVYLWCFYLELKTQINTDYVLMIPPVREQQVL